MGVPIRFHRINSDPKNIRVNVFIDHQLSATLIFDSDNFHEEWDALVDAFIATPTPPGEVDPGT